MKRLIIVLALICGLALPVMAEYKPVVIGDEVITLAGTTVYTLSGTTTWTDQGAVSALITIYGDDVIWKGSSTDPTNSNGAILNEGDYLVLDSPDQITNFGMVLRTGGSASTAYIIYYGPSD